MSGGNPISSRMPRELGSLPALLGFLALTVLFSVLQPDTFFTIRNGANLLNQAAPVIFIAMGLVFVLLIGEIDLSAGFTAGASAAVMAALLTRMELPLAISLVACLTTGVTVGVLIGLLVARLKIPSFVVTLAAFLGLQGALLLIIGEGGTIGVSDPLVLKLMNGNLPPLAGWIMSALIFAGFLWADLRQANARKRAGLTPAKTAVRLGKLAALGAGLILVTYLLNLERAVNPAVSSLRGIPIVVPFTALFVAGLSWMLGRTAIGRHIYAVGGNAEAARRAGIGVTRVKVLCFAACSLLAAIGGVLFASYNNSVSPTTGGASTLLYAVGAAVIGGVSLFGGRGRVIDAVSGGMVVAVIANGLPLITQKAGVQFVVTGLVLLIAAGVDALSRKGAAGR